MNICVYGASSSIIDQIYLDTSYQLGETLAEKGHTLVFGAGKYGMMGACADGALAHGGKVIGVTPRFFLPDGVIHEHCTELILTDTMRERKKAMEDNSDGFIVLPGGVGTFEEFFEILVGRQLAQHAKPIAILNIAGYFDGLLAYLHEITDKMFVNPRAFDLFLVSDDIEETVEYIANNENTGLSDISKYRYIENGVKDEEK